ncbi:hypothetical protein CCM_02689 [Cordyceps militaris CM01]|uniref:Uncharacterized protein n=1 Tax=Cordyceps militaris (strain CM01) TaxID=983644 RepID=G3JB58_CORMM|nr:uncharacterized protein CCM_02689 [Cordyceps militaris CM01]EGX94418.1 hypothetical protein CCM_02689 [Cordyceps militaris CM01]
MQWAALDLFNKKQDPGAAWVEDQDWHHTGQLLRHASSAPNGRATTCKRLSHCLIVVPRVRLSLDAGMSSPRILPISELCTESLDWPPTQSPNCDSPSASTAPLRSSDHKCDNTDCLLSLTGDGKPSRSFPYGARDKLSRMNQLASHPVRHNSSRVPSKSTPLVCFEPQFGLSKIRIASGCWAVSGMWDAGSWQVSKRTFVTSVCAS